MKEIKLPLDYIRNDLVSPSNIDELNDSMINFSNAIIDELLNRILNCKGNLEEISEELKVEITKLI